MTVKEMEPGRSCAPAFAFSVAPEQARGGPVHRFSRERPAAIRSFNNFQIAP